MDGDEELVRKFQAGDSEAFSTFVLKHQDQIYRMAWLWLYSTQDADDVLQEVLLRSYTGLSRFRFRASPLTWILRITRNVCHEYNRRSRRVPLETTEPLAPGAEELCSLEEARMLARERVQALPRRQREVVSLRIFAELSVRDTAAVMGCRPGTVKALLNQAMTRLQADQEVSGK